MEGSASGPSPSAILSPGSSRSPFLARWRCRSRLLLVVAGGARPRGGWCSFAIAQLQGFSSASRAAVSHQWSSTRMTTSLVVVGSEPGCGLPLVLSFKDVHQPCRGGERAELWFRLPQELVARFFLQHSEKRMHTSLAKEANFDYVVPAGPQAPSAAELPTPWLGWSCRHPCRGRGRGPLRHGARAEVVAVAGAEVVAATGKPPRRIPRGQWPRASSATLLASSSLHL